VLAGRLRCRSERFHFMGTRAWVKFPTYTVTSAIENDQVVQHFGEPTGELYVFVPYDGDTLPIDVQTSIQFMFAHSKAGNLAVPEGLAAWLVAKLQSNYGDPDIDLVSTYIYSHQPEDDAFGMEVDFKTQRVTYLDGSDRSWSFRRFVDRTHGLVFSS
jgi:hypothetical protein